MPANYPMSDDDLVVFLVFLAVLMIGGVVLLGVVAVGAIASVVQMVFSVTGV